jgi:hypothetical protein
MTVPSNLYAEKVFAEHPTILWALDDTVDYISLINEADRDVSGWTITNATATTSTISNEPFPDSITSFIDGDVPTGSFETVSCVSQNIINFTNLSADMKTFCVGAYFYSDSAYLTSVSIGYQYTDTTSSQIVEKLQTFNTSVYQSWSFISGTFDIPNENTELRMVIKFKYLSGGISSDYQFYLNGISLGQWSEDFNIQSLGVVPVSLPSNIPLITPFCIPADPYGLGGDNGYYLVNDNSLKARNTALPMVYGGSNITRLRPNNNEPSLIVPGKGFLNKDGQYKEYTAEFWMRVNSNTFTPKRIFGPIASTDGLYIEGGFLTLVVGKQFASHFVGEWFRPMLVHVRLIRNSATVLINGDLVITLNIETDNLQLPDATDSFGDNQDWLGFYSYENVTPIELDCIAIYPYSVAINVAKRRWVYGQGVVSPEEINSAYGGTQAFIDYTFADYTANYNYPDFARWDQGTFDNLVTTETSITTPAYTLPEISLSTKTLKELYDDNQAIQDPNDDTFITFRPNTSWASVQSYFNFPRFNIINTGIQSIYGVFSSDDLTTEETLFKIYNSLTGNSFSVRKDLDEIHYYLTFNGIEEEIYTTGIILENEKYSAGIQIQTLSNYFGGNVAAFFGNQNGLKMYVGGDETSNYQFTGKIYSIGLSSTYNASEITDHFETNGTAILDSYLATGSAESANALALLEHTASYTLLPTQAYDTYYLDIGVAGYWEDYLPLSYFAQFVNSETGGTYYDLDFLQFNIGYPRPSEYLEIEETSSWSYEQLDQEFDHPVQRTYAELDNYLFTGWNNYEDMDSKSIKFYEYDTTEASIRSYLSFQYVSTGANAPQSFFINTEPPKEGGIIDISEYNNWDKTKFEVVDNTLIYPNKTVDFNELAIVYHLNFNIRGVLTKPITLRRLELASQAFNDNSFNPVGTRFGLQMFPYKRAGFYYDYKAKNPFSIYKGSTPYLYLNRTSGVEIRGAYDPEVSRGIAIPINSTIATNYRVSAIQMWMRYDLDKFPLVETELFEIEYKGDTIKFFIQALDEDGSRSKIFAKSVSTGLAFNGLAYYWNGSLVREPVMTTKEWGVLGITFSNALNFDLYLGGINLNGPVVFNNIAYYQANNLQQVQSTLTRSWLRVESDGITNYDWEYWLNSFTWDGVLVISSSDLYGVNPADVYKSYIGTNKIIIDDNEGLSIEPNNLSIYSEVIWSTNVATPV